MEPIGSLVGARSQPDAPRNPENVTDELCAREGAVWKDL